MQKIFVIALLSIVMLAGCVGIVKNGAKIITVPNGNDTLEIPPPPSGYIVKDINVGDRISVTYKSIRGNTVIVKDYYKQVFMDKGAKSYILKFTH